MRLVLGCNVFGSSLQCFGLSLQCFSSSLQYVWVADVFGAPANFVGYSAGATTGEAKVMHHYDLQVDVAAIATADSLRAHPQPTTHAGFGLHDHEPC